MPPEVHSSASDDAASAESRSGKPSAGAHLVGYPRVGPGDLSLPDLVHREPPRPMVIHLRSPHGNRGSAWLGGRSTTGCVPQAPPSHSSCLCPTGSVVSCASSCGGKRAPTLVNVSGSSAAPHAPCRRGMPAWHEWPRKHRAHARQTALLQLVRAGSTNRQIARRMVLSEGTVRTHLNNIYARLDARSRTEAATRLFGQGELTA